VGPTSNRPSLQNSQYDSLPGLHTYFVGDQQGRPLLFLTEEATNLAKAMPKIVDAIRQVLGKRPFTIIFDRGGYDGELFSWLQAQGITFITYQKGSPKLPLDRFRRRQTLFEGKRMRMSIAEDTSKVDGGGPWRRVVVRTPNGHQTPILTNLAQEVKAVRIACLMFARWRQENFFKYMRHNQGLDQLVSNGYQEADPNLMVTNPERIRLERELVRQRKQLAQLQADLGRSLTTSSAPRRKLVEADSIAVVHAQEKVIATLQVELTACPTHLPLAESGKSRHLLRLDHKSLVDQVKICAYQAEEWLLDRLALHYHNPNDVRDLLRAFAHLSGQMQATTLGVTITLDPPDTPMHRRALQCLCRDLNALGATYPGSHLPVSYQVAMHHSQAAA
jgi:hypothetical protein